MQKSLLTSTRAASLVGALLLLPGCTARTEPLRTGQEFLPSLVAQRVTATVRREALRLVQLETEHEAFLTTPEHPFATLRSGWVSARRLVPGDWLISQRFGAVRLLSVSSESVVWPAEVFNLSVAPSHSYFVGTDRVLVHNTKCKQSPSEASEEKLERALRERDELSREIKALTKATPSSPRLGELKAQREKLSNQLKHLRRVHRSGGGERGPSQALQRSAAEDEAAQQALEEAKKELADLENRAPSAEAETAAFATRKGELERRVKALTFSHERTSRILTLARELADLEKVTPETDADRRTLDAGKQELRANLKLERRRARVLKFVRAKRADPEGRRARYEYDRDVIRRQRRSAPYLADTARPRDRLELLQDELAGWLQAPPSESREMRIHHLTDQIEAMRELVEIRKKHHRLVRRRYALRSVRETASAEGEGTSEINERLAQTEREIHAARVQRAQLRVRERLLAQLDDTPWAHSPGSVDEARLREFEHQLAAGLESGRQLTDIERALDAMAPSDADLRETALEEAHAANELSGEREQLLGHTSPEPASGLQPKYARLEQELRQERAAVEVRVLALVSEQARIQTTQAASSGGPSWQERLRGVQEELVLLRAHWRAGLEARLADARHEIHIRRSIERFGDEVAEAELLRAVALLERELQSSI